MPLSPDLAALRELDGRALGTPMRVPEVLSRYAHVERDHNQVQAAIAAVATANADATYGQPEADLINELKAQLNLVLAALRAQGAILP